MRWYGGKIRRTSRKEAENMEIDKEATIKQQQCAYIKAALGEAIAACQKFPLEHPDMLEPAMYLSLLIGAMKSADSQQDLNKYSADWDKQKILFSS